MIQDLPSRPRHGLAVPLPDDVGSLDARTLLGERPGAELLSALRRSDPETVEDQIRVTRVPAPPFAEARRAAWMAERFRVAGLSEVRLDEVGNVLGTRHGADPLAPPIVLAAHLDTVFPAETRIVVRREGDLILGPGISDDGRGLAALLAMIRVLGETDTATTHPLRFVATVGEEGLGDLRGVRWLCTEGAGRDALAFISLDGAGTGRVVTSGIGSRRYRAVVVGPGGHSWVDWGRPNPIAILAAALGRLPAPQNLPRGTTWSAGRIGGGTSVNAIPEEAWLELEVRAERVEDLQRVDALLTDSFERAVAEANRPDDPLELRASLELTRIGDRPSGSTAPDHLLVRAAVAATRSLGLPVELATSSTDANLPMSVGIPAITLGAGGEAGGAHTLSEWYRNIQGPEGIYRAVATVLLLDRWVADGMRSAPEEGGTPNREAAD